MSIQLTNDRREEIKRMIVDLFCDLNIHCVPISGFEIATKLGATVMPYSSQEEKIRMQMMKISEDGFTIQRKEKRVIFYNDDRVYGRINNTITHECGHIVMDHLETSELAEAEAKFFAKYALAPPPLVHQLGLKDPYEIMARFDISLEAAFYAYNYYKNG